MKKETLVFIFDGYADWETAYVCPELNAPTTGYVVKTVGLDKNVKTSMGGFKIVPDYSIDDYPSEFSLLILTGGNAWAEQKNTAILPIVEYAVSHKLPVGAICDATIFMAEHGYLNAIKHTGNTLAYMRTQAPHYCGEEFFVEKQAVCDANIITANGSATLEFANEIFKLLNIKTDKELCEWYNLHKNGFYQ